MLYRPIQHEIQPIQHDFYTASYTACAPSDAGPTTMDHRDTGHGGRQHTSQMWHMAQHSPGMSRQCSHSPGWPPEWLPPRPMTRHSTLYSKSQYSTLYSKSLLYWPIQQTRIVTGGLQRLYSNTAYTALYSAIQLQYKLELYSQ